MTEEFTDDQEKKVNEIAAYIQDKERTLSALNTAIVQASTPVYSQKLAVLANLLYEDKIPLKGAFDTGKYFPDLYPRAVQKPKKEEKESEE